MRLIDADRLKAELKTLPIMSNWGEVFMPELIDKQPTIKERKTAHWAGHNYDGEDYGIFLCSNCIKASLQYTDYCPHCGCKMMEVEHE